jgi:uncharacterized protein YjaG (DUF416 family)
MKPYDKDERTRLLGRFDQRKKLLFALLCADRLAPCLQKLAEIRPELDGEVARDAINWLWETIKQESRSPYALEAQKKKARCEALLPEWDERNYNWAAQASDAVSAAINCLSLALSDDTEAAVDASIAVVESVYVYIRCTLDPNGFDLTADEICEHHLMKNELGKQEADIAFIENLDDVTGATIEFMRRINEQNVVNVCPD